MPKNRNNSIDLLRGFIMMLMAIDHVGLFVGKVHASEFWGVNLNPYESTGWFLSRLITHFCAPGFFLLMGMSMAFFAVSRTQKGWSQGKISQYFIKRGLLLVFVQYFIEAPGWALGMIFANGDAMPNHPMPGTEGPVFLFFAVLSILGFSMLVTGLLLRFSSKILAPIPILCVTLSWWIIPDPSGVDTAFHPFLRFLMIPGTSSPVVVIYPLIPWVGVAILGVLLGRLLMQQKEQAYSIILGMGISFLIAFFLIRSVGDFGNFQYSNTSTWIDYFTLIKYPPSLCFLLFTLGVNLVLFYGFHKTSTFFTKTPLLVYGQTALFFYIAHLYVYAVMGWPFPSGAALWVVYIAWMLGLIILYFLCKRYRSFKNAKPLDSLWRFF